MSPVNQQRRATFRQIGLIALLMALWWGVEQLNNAVSNRRAVLSGPEGALLYAAAFDGFSDEWEQYQGRRMAQIIEGTLELSGNEGTFYSAALPSFANFDAQIDVNPLENPNDEGFGLVFRLRDPQNLYFFFISSDGYYRVSRVVNGVEKRLSTWIPSEHIRQGTNTINRLRVIGLGSQFQFYINGQIVPLCIPDSPQGESTYSAGQCFGTMTETLSDETFAEGQLGAVIQASGDDMRVRFDHFLVFQPDVSSFVYRLFERIPTGLLSIVGV